MKTYKTPCKNCLFHKNAIVYPESVTTYIKRCLAEDTHFVCHVNQVRGIEEEIICRGFFNAHQDQDHILYGCGQLLRTMERCGGMREVDVPEDVEALTPARVWKKQPDEK
jgi:hypothetical protein